VESRIRPELPSVFHWLRCLLFLPLPLSIPLPIRFRILRSVDLGTATRLRFSPLVCPLALRFSFSVFPFHSLSLSLSLSSLRRSRSHESSLAHSRFSYLPPRLARCAVRACTRLFARASSRSRNKGRRRVEGTRGRLFAFRTDSVFLSTFFPDVTAKRAD